MGALASISLAGYLAYWACVEKSVQGEAQGFAWFVPFFEVPGSADWQDTAALAVFLFGCSVCFLCSTVFHTSLCHREDVST